eukprot:SAG31_NODE_2575_length_5453_cov_7.045013_5_plen_154_part_00
MLTRLCKAEPDNGEAWRLLGQCHADNDDDSKAIKCLSAAVKADPANLKALAAIGVAYFNEQDKERAAQTLQDWVSKHPKYGTVSESFVAKDTDSPEEKIANLYKAVTDSAPDDPEPRVVTRPVGYEIEQTSHMLMLCRFSVWPIIFAVISTQP